MIRKIPHINACYNFYFTNNYFWLVQSIILLNIFFFIDGEFYQQLSMLITHQLKIKLVGIGCVIVFCMIIIYKKVRQPFSVVLKVRVWCENRSNMLNFTYLTSYYYNSVLFAFLRDFVLFWVKICTLYKLKKRLIFDETISIWINNQ